MSGAMQKRKYHPGADERVMGRSGQRIHPLFKAFTLPQKADGARAKQRRKFQR